MLTIAYSCAFTEVVRLLWYFLHVHHYTGADRTASDITESADDRLVANAKPSSNVPAAAQLGVLIRAVVDVRFTDLMDPRIFDLINARDD